MRSDLDYLWTGAELASRAYMTRNHIRMPQPNLNTQAEVIQPSFSDLYKKFSIMSERRTILSRPRTKVYESNYNIGESYYKPMVDHLDRKYSGRPLLPPSPPRDFTSPRRSLEEDFRRDRDMERAQSHLSQAKDDFFERASNAQKEADAFFDRHGRRTEADSFLDRHSSHHKSDTQDFFDKAVSKAEESFSEKSHNLRQKADALVEKALSRSSALEEDEDPIASQLNRIKASRAERHAARDDELEFAMNGIKPTSQVLRYKFGFHDKMLDTVGVDGRFQERLIDDIIRRRNEPALEFPEEQLPAFPIVGKWSALNDLTEAELAAISSASDSQAQLKARHNQIRVTNINAELSAIQERTEARSRRLAEIKSLLAENDALSTLSHAVHERNLSDRTLSSLANHGLSSATHGLSSASHGLSSLANHGLSSSIATHGLSSLATHGLSHVIPERSQGLALKSIGY
ncbi:uncharacterized protein LOC103508110 isoform X2 [Diaphorina citri]|uniref:Uncharacterized protein LOC103508110 isoform X1 n=1 Tax=Diaphorina citri TaxID=121845 RepID=A0A3Q0IR07_DIACI|nr:uncharacterized protein LOC103508110 isoform X1 [Diaphorina citri]XP_026678729.1 uncharacterized protein LOC103508110 isoform X1 [Diaphorina citri]XP_026678732.1 uncharacterized protein LOC103508110 isoform X2 [Diaphorina citri]